MMDLFIECYVELSNSSLIMNFLGSSSKFTDFSTLYVIPLKYYQDINLHDFANGYSRQ